MLRIGEVSAIPSTARFKHYVTSFRDPVPRPDDAIIVDNPQADETAEMRKASKRPALAPYSSSINLIEPISAELKGLLRTVALRTIPSCGTPTGKPSSAPRQESAATASSHSRK